MQSNFTTNCKESVDSLVSGLWFHYILVIGINEINHELIILLILKFDIGKSEIKSTGIFYRFCTVSDKFTQYLFDGSIKQQWIQYP